VAAFRQTEVVGLVSLPTFQLSDSYIRALQFRLTDTFIPSSAVSSMGAAWTSYLSTATTIRACATQILSVLLAYRLTYLIRARVCASSFMHQFKATQRHATHATSRNPGPSNATPRNPGPRSAAQRNATQRKLVTSCEK